MDTLLSCTLECFHKILNINVVGEVDVVLWNGFTNLNSYLITYVLFKDLHEVDWHKGIWFEGKVLNYSLYAWLAMKKRPQKF